MNSKLVTLYSEYNMGNVLYPQESFHTCHIPSRQKWTNEGQFLLNWWLLLCAEQVSVIYAYLFIYSFIYFIYAYLFSVPWQVHNEFKVAVKVQRKWTYLLKSNLPAEHFSVNNFVITLLDLISDQTNFLFLIVNFIRN